MTVRPGGTPRTSLSRHSRRLVGIAMTLPALLLAALLVIPGAASAGVFGPDLTVTMADSPDPVSPGGTVTLTILVSNTGGEDSFDTHLDFSTAGQSVLSAQVTGGGVEDCSVATTTASCDLGFLASSNSTGEAIAPLLAFNEAEVVIEVEAPDAPGTEFQSTATASSTGQSDEFPPDNTDTELTNVSEFESASGTVPPGGSITTLNGPLNAGDPFAVALKNVGTQPLEVTIEEEPCDGTQEGDPLCNEPRVGGVAGDFIFQPSGGGGALAGGSTQPIVVARLFYDVSVLVGVRGFRIFWQKTPSGPVLRLPRCDDGITTECFGKTIKANGDQIIRIRLKDDPRFTRG